MLRDDGAGDFSLEKIPLDDPAAYAVFARANTTAILPVLNRTASRPGERARPDRFEASSRSWPCTGRVRWSSYGIRGAQARKRVDILDPRLETILKPTYGIMVYQEQVMQSRSCWAATRSRRRPAAPCDGQEGREGNGDAPRCLRRRRRKKPLPRAKAILLFDLMEKFAGYGFNKSHAPTLRRSSYQTRYLKGAHPAASWRPTLSA